MNDKVIDWLYGVIAKPVPTLNEIAREKPVGWALTIYLGVSALAMVASLYSGGSHGSMEYIMSEFNFHLSKAVLIAGVIMFSLLTVFIFTGLAHLFARLFGGRAGYWNLFSAYAFAGFPVIINVPILFVMSFLGVVGGVLGGLLSFGISVWIIILQVVAIRESHAISTGASIGVYVISVFILVVVAVAISAAFVYSVFMAI